MLGCNNANNVPYTIGFFTTVTNLEYSTLLAGTVTKIAEEKNINLINFLGGSLNPNFTFSQYKYSSFTYYLVPISYPTVIIYYTQILTLYTVVVNIFLYTLHFYQQLLYNQLCIYTLYTITF